MTASVDGTVRLWNPLDGMELLTIVEGIDINNLVTKIGWSSDGKRLAIRSKQMLKIVDSTWIAPPR